MKVGLGIVAVLYLAAAAAGCPAPTGVEHAIHCPIKPVYSVNETISFECEACYVLSSGDLTMICTATGSWDGTPPVCIEKEIVDITKDYKTVSQSSEHSNYRPASLALDGDFNTISVTAQETNPWWKLEFCKPVAVETVKIWNRNDCCEEQFSPLNISVDSHLCGQVDGPVALGDSVEIQCSVPLIGSTLEITRAKENDFLNLAEVQVTVSAICPAPDVVGNATQSPVKTFYLPGDQITYECDTCYYLQGDSVRNCTDGGTWTGNPPVCIANEIVVVTQDYKTVSQSSEHSNFRPASLALDGDFNTISVTAQETNPWWKLEFCQPVTIETVTIWNRNDCCADQFSPLNISVDSHLCGQVDGPVSLGDSVEIQCSVPLTGSTLEIIRAKENDFLNLAEVQVTVRCLEPDPVGNATQSPVKTSYLPGDQIAYECDTCFYLQGDSVRNCTNAGTWSGSPPVCTEKEIVDITKDFKTVSQSSEHSNYRPASLALDGDFNTISVTAQETNPWWKLEFCRPVTIGMVKIWNRNDCCSDQFSPLNISVDSQLCGQVDGPVFLGGSVEIQCSVPLTGSTLKITRAKANDFLNLAEVQVTDLQT